MPDQRLAQIVLQKRMLDADQTRRRVAVAASGVAALLFLSPLQVALYIGSHFLADVALLLALTRLISRPDSVFWLRAMQLAAFAAMSSFLGPAVLLWLEPGITPKIGAIIHIFGGMLSIMLVRTAFLPLTIANSLPLIGVVIVLAALERGTIPWQEEVFLGFAVAVLAGYFILTLITAQRINKKLAGARDEALARVETQKRFLATMSHELRTPLNGILGAAQSIAASHPGIGAETIRDSARDMAAMVDDLLDNAAIAAGALRINRQPVRLSDVMDRLKDRWQAAFAAKGLTLDVRLSSDLPEAALIDPLRLSQGLSNLLANALRLTGKGGVVLALSRHPAGLEAIVTDTGPGLPEGAESRLFQPFETFGPPSDDTGSSTGLGLSITQGLARAMGGGGIWFSSVPQGAAAGFA